MYLGRRISALMLSVAFGAMLTNCSSTAAGQSGSLPSVARPDSCPLAAAQVGGGGGGCGGGSGGNQLYADGLVNWDATTNSGNVTVSDSAGASTPVSATIGTTQSSYTTILGGTSYSATVPTSINQNGTTALSDGTITVNSSTGVAQAVVTDTTGVQWTITGSSNSTTAGMNVSITNTSGYSWSGAVNPPSTSGDSAHREGSGFCGTAKDASQFFGNVGNIATGVAVIGALVGAEPVAIVAGGVGGLCLGIAGVAGLYGEFFCAK